VSLWLSKNSNVKAQQGITFPEHQLRPTDYRHTSQSCC